MQLSAAPPGSLRAGLLVSTLYCMLGRGGRAQCRRDVQGSRPSAELRCHTAQVTMVAHAMPAHEASILQWHVRNLQTEGLLPALYISSTAGAGSCLSA
jgi:hypothetical protein